MSITVTHENIEYRLTLRWKNEDDFEFSLVEAKDLSRPEQRGWWAEIYSVSNRNQEDVSDLLEELYLLALEHEDLPRDYAESLTEAAEHAAELAYDMAREDK